MPRRIDRDLQPSVRQCQKRDENQDEDRDGNQEKYQDEKHEAEKYDFLAFMSAAGFEEDELLVVIAELDAYKSIPGTTLNRYVHRVQSSVETDSRLAFLKGVIVGTAIGENLVVEEVDLDRRIDAEVKRRLQLILDDLDRI